MSALQASRAGTGRPVLALCDASTAGRQAAWRAALVAREWDCHLRLLQAVAVQGQHDEAQQRLLRLAAELHDRVRVTVEVEVVVGDPLREVRREADEAALVVLGSGGGNTLRDWVMGTQAERLIRLLRVPVLVVKRAPLGAYRRLLVPVDLAPGSEAAVALAGTLSRAARPLEVFHALPRSVDVTLRAADLPELVVRSRRRRLVQRARVLLRQLILRVGADRLRASAFIGMGHAAVSVVERARAIRAEVIVIGKRHRGLLADFLLGSVTQGVLAEAEMDVLVMPAGPVQGTAGLRLSASPAGGGG